MHDKIAMPAIKPGQNLMNLPLHFGLLGVIEAGLIAFAAGILAFLLWQRICRAADLSMGHAIGWAFVSAFVASGSIDAWKLFYIGMVKLESPLYARIALQSIHDPNSLGGRVMAELMGSLFGVVLGWQWFSKKDHDAALTSDDESTSSER